MLTTDASNDAIGAILSQGPVAKDLPIVYASRTFNNAERNYPTIEKEHEGQLSYSKQYQGSDKVAFCHHYCSCWLWMVYCVEPWMERKED